MLFVKEYLSGIQQTLQHSFMSSANSCYSELGKCGFFPANWAVQTNFYGYIVKVQYCSKLKVYDIIIYH